MSSKLTGVVLSIKMQDTLVVSVERTIRHSRYDKVIRKTTKFYVHAPQHNIAAGDTVNFKECKPLSKLKKWVLVT
ncbi:MAG: 30S ribosomal protein S17 [Legionellales bacterium]|nr:MAG: 30S ribosomal protein S17 [Legionellales bacterium]